MISGDNQDSKKNTDDMNDMKKNWVKKSILSEFTIKIRSTGGIFDGGEISCAWADKIQKINDMGDIIKFIEEQCDTAGYPQSQRKLRDWNA